MQGFLLVLYKWSDSLVVLLSLLVVAGCSTTVRTGYENRPGISAKYQNPDQPTTLNTVQMESNDIQSAVAKVVRSMLANPLLAGQERAPHLILDSRYFVNESAERINKRMIVDLLRSEILNAAGDRMILVNREYAEMVESERELSQDGVVDPGTTPLARRPLGGDYRLGGRITELTRSDASSGEIHRYTQITFEITDLKTNQLVFSETCSYKKAGRDAVIYR